jgi:formate hydrogenlyase transcriptional activator
MPPMPLRSIGVAERPAASLQSQLEGLLEGAQDCVYGIDNRGHATMVTPSVAAVTGYTLDDLMGRSMHELLHHSHPNGDCYPRSSCPIYAAFRDGRVHTAEEVFWRKDGTSFPVSYTSTPLTRGGEVVGAVVVFRRLADKKELHGRLRRMLSALERELAAEDDEGRSPPPSEPAPPLVGTSPAWQASMDAVRRVAGTDTTVLLLGESGTGKELVARAIHQLSPRRQAPLVKVNCAAIPATLVESELFGHERGAFTGATGLRLGRFEQAGRGTLLLDEVGELPLDVQAKLLRVLQEREFERLGGTRTIGSEARVLAATNRDLGALVAAGRFRADLYYRLNVFPLHLPALRERRGDVPLLARHFLSKLARRLGRPLTGFTAEGEQRLCGHHWPGNVRELENVVERAAILSDGPLLDVGLMEGARPAGMTPPPQPPAPAERASIVAALERAGWKVTGPRGAAAALAMHPNTLRYRMGRLGIRRPLGA